MLGSILNRERRCAVSAEKATGVEAPASRRRRLSATETARLSFRVSAHNTLADLVMERVGGDYVAATHVLGFISAFGVFVEQNGREPRSVVQLASSVKSKRSRATIDRWASKFREAFPEYEMPAVLWASVREQVMGDPSLFPGDKLDADVLSLKIGAVPL